MKTKLNIKIIDSDNRIDNVESMNKNQMTNEEYFLDLQNRRNKLLSAFDKLQIKEDEIENDKSLSSEERVKIKKELLEQYQEISLKLNQLTEEAENFVKQLENR